MRFPQVSDRVKEAPAQALRGVFAGIGQLLLFTDKLRNKAPAASRKPEISAPQPAGAVPDRAAPVPDRTAVAGRAGEPEPEPAAEPPAPAAAEPGDYVNVRLLPSDGAAAADKGEAASVTAAGLPVPNYDQLSVASLRARLRNLDVAQLRQLTRYEQGHAGRPEIVAMYERRIAKLEAEGD